MFIVHAVTVSPNEISMLVGTWYQGVKVTVYPIEADCKEVTWQSDTPSVATVNSTNGYIYGVAPGTAKIYATSMDGTNCSDYIEVTVVNPPPANDYVHVTAIEISPKQKTIAPGDNTTISVKLSPRCVTNNNVSWTSSDPSVATVAPAAGFVKGIANGTTTITATTADGGKTDTCTVTVDSREKVLVKKDSDSFYVEFVDGKVWKNIGCDLSLQENRSGYPMDNPDYYSSLNDSEKRYLSNIENTFSVQQIAFLYLLDPLGIEFYMRTNACANMTLGATLFFKDRVYKEIFGVWTRLIKVFPDKTIQYFGYYTSISAETRADYYTDAEILFGEHPIYDLLSLISFLLDVIPSASLSLFSIFYPPAGVVLGSIDLVKFLFFSASASGVLSSGANSMMEEYTTHVYTLSDGESAGVKAGKAMGWVNFVLGTFSTILDASEVFTPSINDITTYNKVNEGNYRVNYTVGGSELSMADIISRIS